MNVIQSGSYENITASANCMSRPGALIGIFVASASSTPVITVYDSATTTTTTLIVNAFTPIGGTFYPIPAQVASGVYVVISGTVDCTVFTIAN